MMEKKLNQFKVKLSFVKREYKEENCMNKEGKVNDTHKIKK